MTQHRTRRLRSGFTTGAAAAAAAKGALSLILDRTVPRTVPITFLSGQTQPIAIHSAVLETVRRACCTVIKDAGDDPDITHRAQIGAQVRIRRNPGATRIRITGGQGVGRVTKPGLEVAVGQAAINPGPIRMIRQAVQQVLSDHHLTRRVQVEIFVPKGQDLAKKTLNARLGIVGGISILGTTGIERPMSHEAYLATIEKSLSVARACRIEQAVLTTGRRSERFAQDLWPQTAPEALIQMGDFFKASLQKAAGFGFQGVTLAVFFGKALKMAQGSEQTHAACSRLSLETLGRWSLAVTGASALEQRIRTANTARQAFDLLQKDAPQVISRVGDELAACARRFAGPGLKVRAVIFDYQGRVAYDSQPAETAEKQHIVPQGY